MWIRTRATRCPRALALCRRCARRWCLISRTSAPPKVLDKPPPPPKAQAQQPAEKALYKQKKAHRQPAVAASVVQGVRAHLARTQLLAAFPRLRARASVRAARRASNHEKHLAALAHEARAAFARMRESLDCLKRLRRARALAAVRGPLCVHLHQGSCCALGQAPQGHQARRHRSFPAVALAGVRGGLRRCHWHSTHARHMTNARRAMQVACRFAEACWRRMGGGSMPAAAMPLLLLPKKSATA